MTENNGNLRPCANCGSLAEPEDRFCDVCGARISPGSQDADADQPALTAVEPLRRSTSRVASRNRVLKFGSAAALVALLAFGVFAGLSLLGNAASSREAAHGKAPADASTPVPTQASAPTPTVASPSTPTVASPTCAISPAPAARNQYDNSGISGSDCDVNPAAPAAPASAAPASPPPYYPSITDISDAAAAAHDTAMHIIDNIR